MMMHFAARLSSVVLVALLVGLPAAVAAQALPKAASPEAVGLSAERLGRLTRVMQDATRERQVAGTVTLVVRDGQVAYFEAAGAADLEQGTPMRTDTIFRIASMTKAVVSVGIMMLVEEGRVALTDPVSKFIPAFATTTVLASEGGRVAVVPARRAITIRDLLTHTAGISYGAGVLAPYYTPAGFETWYFADRTQNMSAWMDKLATLPFEAQPGERWVYGFNTDVLGNVIERVSGQTLAEYLGARLLTPLKMVDTSFFLPADKASRFAAVYAPGADGKITRAPEGRSGQGQYVGGPQVAFSGGAGLLSTAQDYARFLQMLVNGGELEGTRYLSPTTVALMTSNHVGTLYQNGALGWGLGFEVVEQAGRAPRYGAAGEFSWSGAYHTSFWADPAEKLAVVFMTQLMPAGSVDLNRRVRTLVNQAIVGPAPARSTPATTSAQRVPARSGGGR
jgi:CubicO group peptidase (beta-lactamase class C family)